MQKSICRTVCRNPGCTHRSFSCSNHPAADEGFHQSAGSAPVRVHAGSESDRRHPGLLQDAECYHRSVEPSALLQSYKNNFTLKVPMDFNGNISCSRNTLADGYIINQRFHDFTGKVFQVGILFDYFAAIVARRYFFFEFG